MRQIVLLRGVNLGARNRIAMPKLRDAMTAAGFAEVATYVQSGNVVLTSDAPPERIAAKTQRLIADAFGLDRGVVVRTRDELAAVARADDDAEVEPERIRDQPHARRARRRRRAQP